MKRVLRYGLLLTFSITAINLVFSLLFRIISRELPESLWLRFAALFLAAFLSALVITVLVIAASPTLKEWLLTFRSLNRLTQLNHPLLLKLSREAPGTFHHALIVAELASRAAKSIGADAQLTRIAGLFHDIGKLNHPESFVENQQGPNPHELWDDPEESAKVIIGHVKDGAVLAKQHELPKEVTDCIVQHHGTLPLTQFLEKARAKNRNVSSRKFRYGGPRPLSREAALLMLADHAEAKIRGLPNKNPTAIRLAVEEAITERYREKQLDLSGLGQSDFNRIRDSFTESFLVLHHRRLPRPLFTGHASYR